MRAQNTNELIKEAYGYDPRTLKDDLIKISEADKRDIIALINIAQHMGIISRKYARELMPT